MAEGGILALQVKLNWKLPYPGQCGGGGGGGGGAEVVKINNILKRGHEKL